MAVLLLRTGTDVPSAERMLREGFVTAASQKARSKSRRATQSEIASLTGLSRVEVRKIERAGKSNAALVAVQRLGRIDRLVQAWRTEKKFLDKRGKSRPLNAVGAKSEFAELARKHGGDVTARTLKDQMTRLGIASMRKGKLTLLSSPTVRNSELAAARADLRCVADYLDDVAWEMGRRTYSTSKLILQMAERRTAQMFRRTALQNIETTLRALKELAKRTSNNGRRSHVTKSRVLIHVSIASEARDKHR
jgi:hypothetical protein